MLLLFRVALVVLLVTLAQAESAHHRRRHVDTNASTTHGHHTCSSFIAFKLAETGSTWFASLLKGTPAYWLKEEMYTGKDKNVPDLIKRREIGKVLNCEAHPSSAVNGLTINPKNNPDVDWGAIIDDAPHSAIVKWSRSNVVKTVMSMVRKNLGVCGSKNNIRGSTNVDCINEKKKFDVKQVMHYFVAISSYTSALDKAFDQARQHHTDRSIVIYYEGMQEHEEREMGRLATMLGRSTFSTPKSNVIKKTSDDLRDVIINYEEVLDFLVSLKVPVDYNCPIVDMFTTTAFKIFVGCNYDKLTSYLAAKQNTAFKGNAGADKSGNAGAAKSGNAGADKSGNAGAAKSGNAGADKSGNAGAAKSGNAGADKSGNAGAAKSGNAGADKSGNAGAAKSGNAPGWGVLRYNSTASHNT